MPAIALVLISTEPGRDQSMVMMLRPCLKYQKPWFCLENTTHIAKSTLMIFRVVKTHLATIRTLDGVVDTTTLTAINGE